MKDSDEEVDLASAGMSRRTDCGCGKGDACQEDDFVRGAVPDGGFVGYAEGRALRPVCESCGSLRDRHLLSVVLRQRADSYFADSREVDPDMAAVYRTIAGELRKIATDLGLT